MSHRIILFLWFATTIAILIFWNWAVGSTWRTELDSLFSGVAFAALIATVFLQMIELRDTRTELKRTAAAQEKSEAALTVQCLINCYSALLVYYHDRNQAIETNQRDHCRNRLKELVDNGEVLLAGKKPVRPEGWERL